MASAGHLSETAQAEGKQNTQAALAQFTEWFWKTHPDDYAKWKETVQKGSQACVCRMLCEVEFRQLAGVVTWARTARVA